MPSLFETATGLLGEGDAMSKLAGLLDGDATQAESVSNVGIPAIIGGLADKAANGGADSVMGMLDSIDGPATDDVVGFLDAGDPQAGNGMLDQLFGSNRTDLVSALAAKAVVGRGTIGKALPMLAPLVLGALAGRRGEGDLDAAGVASVLASEKADLDRKGLLAGAGAGTGPAQSAANGAGGRGMGWLPWAVGAIGVVLILAWLLSRCNTIDDEGTTTTNSSVLSADDPDAADDADESSDTTTTEESTTTTEADEGAGDLQGDVDSALAATGVDGAVDGDTVTLTGTVDSDDDRLAAIDSVEAVAGVGSVVDEIEVSGDGDSDGAAAGDGEGDSGDTINELLDLDPVTFAVTSDRITADGRAVLDQAADFLTANPDVEVEIGGHTDDDGAEAANLDLSQRRADSVKSYLVDQGVDADRMTTKGYGESEPKVPNDSQAAKAENRRIEFTIQ